MDTPESCLSRHRDNHDLRHTWATLALVAGVDVKIVSERLGHSSPMITWQTYQHAIGGMQTDAAERVRLSRGLLK